MKTNDFLYLALLHRTLDYEKDTDPENWRTIKGAHVHVDNEGKIDGGAGGKFNGKGVLPRSLFPGQGKAKQTEFAEVTAKRKETEEAAKKAAAEAKERHKKEMAEARKAKLEKQRELEKRRPELKQKFNDLRESYHKETDAKKKKAIIKQLKEIESEYKDKFGKHPDDDNIKLPEKKATGSESERYEAKQKITEIHKTMRKLPYNAEREKLTEQFHKLYNEYTEKYGIEPPFDHPKKPKAKPASAAESYKEIEIPAMTANPFKEREKGREQTEARRKAWESILTDENLIAAEWTFPNGNKNVLSRSVKSDGWQLSWFNKEGEPFGDTQGESPMELYNRNPGDFTTKSGLKVSAVFSDERRYG